MTTEQFLKNLTPPAGAVDVVLDTDAFAEIDDQFAIGYLLANREKLHIKGLCAAPYSGDLTPEESMRLSYGEIKKVLTLAGREDLLDCVHYGSTHYLPDEKTPVDSDAARFLAELAKNYTPENPLYIVGIGSIPNIASALLLNPDMKETVVIVWLGGHAWHWKDTREYNMIQDIAGARVVFGSGVPLVQLPCFGVVDSFSTSQYELEHWLRGKNALCDYLVDNTVRAAERYAKGRPWTRIIWDVTTLAWLLNDGKNLVSWELRPTPMPGYDGVYIHDNNARLMCYVTHIDRDMLFTDLFAKLGEL